MVEVMKVMETSFKGSDVCTATLTAPSSTAGHYGPMPPLETPGHSQASLHQFLLRSLNLSPGSWCTQGSVCALQVSISQSCISSGTSQFSSVTQSCLTLCYPMNCSTPGLPVSHQLLEFTQTHVQWVGDAIKPSDLLFPWSSCLQTFQTSGSFLMSQLFAWGGQSTGVSALASFLPKNTQDWSPLEWTGWISLQSMGFSRVFSNNTVSTDFLIIEFKFPVLLTRP